MGFDYDSEEWQEEREEVLEEWDGHCARCGMGTRSPHVHHKYGTSCQEYEVLCPDCHAEHHGNPDIATYRRRPSRCKFCGDIIRWYNENGRWIPLEEQSNERHRCRR